MYSRLASFAVLASLFTISTLPAQVAPPTAQPRASRAASGAQPGLRTMTGPAGPLVTLEVLLIEHNSAIGGKEGVAVPSAAEFVKLYKEGKLDSAARVQLSTVGGSTGTVQLGERVPVATARNARGFGGRGSAEGDGAFSYSYAMQDIGTMIMATARVEESETVLVDLHVERSRLALSDRPADEPQDEIARRKTVSLTSQSTLRLKPGEPAIARAWQTTAGQESNGVFIVSTAQVEASGLGRAAAAQRDGDARLQVFSLRNAKAGNAQRILTMVLAEKLGDRARIGVDENTNRIIVYATAEQHEIIEQLLQHLDASEK
jgi:type II secretory pathway component GspD/PulD (secretin)